MRILITGASTFFAARLIQGFRAAGVDLTIADGKRFSTGKMAGGTSGLRTPPLSLHPGAYLESVLTTLRANPHDLLMPTFEESLLLSEFRDEIEPHTRLLLPPFPVMWQLHHKPSLHRICQELDIPAPPTVVPDLESPLESQVSALRFPVVLKLPAANNCIGRVYCDTVAELGAQFDAIAGVQTARDAEPPFVQQKIDGDPIYTLMFCHEGTKLGEVIYRPLRTYPENSGTSAHRESITHPRIAQLTERLSRATGWSGFLGLDFIVDRHDGVPYLIDANPRPTPAIHLGYLAGVDWSGIIAQIIRGERPVPAVARPGVRNRTVLLDFGWLIEGLRPQRNWPTRALRRVRDFIRPGWKLDSAHDFLGSNEWGCHFMEAFQGFAALGKSMLTGKPLGETILDGSNYDPATVRRLRNHAGHGPVIPAPHLHLAEDSPSGDEPATIRFPTDRSRLHSSH